MTQVRMSGRLAVVNGEVAMSKWSVSEASSPVAIYNSHTGMLPARMHGPLSYSGSIDADRGVPRVMPGQVFTFEGYMGPNNGVAGTPGPMWSGLALVDSVTVNFDWTTNKPVSHALSFSNAGAFTYNAAATAPSLTGDFTPIEVCGKTLRFTPVGGSETELEMVKTATLSLSASNGKVTNSSTGCRTDSIGGPGDCKLSVALDTPGRQLTPGALYTVAIPCGADDWVLQYMICKGYTNLQADRTNGNLIGATVELEYSRFNAAGDAGSGITPPGGSAWIGG